MAVFVAFAALLSSPAQAQNVLPVDVQVSPTTLNVNNTVTYTISISNATIQTQVGISVLNSFSGPENYVQAVTDTGIFTNGNQTVFFSIPNLSPFTTANLIVQIQPTAAGLFTNSISISNINEQVSTNVVVTVTNLPADLSVTIPTPTNGVITGDLFTYQLVVTNQGVLNASSVFLTNFIPSGVTLRGYSPSNQATLGPNSITFNLGALNANTGEVVTVTIQPTNTGNLTLSATLAAAGFSDNNPSNNTASVVVNVTGPVLGQLQATFNSSQQFNPQTGLMEESIVLSNIGTNTVASARVVVMGLTAPDRLFNAVGTNNGSPFVVYPSSLAPGQNVGLLLEYFIPTRTPIPDPTLQAFGVSAVSVSGPTNTSTNLVVKMTMLSADQVLVEFPAVLGRTYQIVYSTNGNFSNPLAAQPSIVAQANWVQWIDNGPPKTISLPSQSPMRIYRVRQLQ